MTHISVTKLGTRYHFAPQAEKEDMMKNSIFLVVASALFFGFSAKSAALLGSDEGSRDLMIILTSKQVDDQLRSLKDKIAIPTRIQGVEFDHCNTETTPLSCTYTLKFSALGADLDDSSIYRCFLKIDVDMKGKISNFSDTSCTAAFGPIEGH